MATTRVRIDRLVAWAPVLLLGGLAALTYWLDAQVQPPRPRSDGASRHDPDLFIDNLSAVTFDASGRVLQALAATRAEHFPDDDSIALVRPALTVTEPGKPRLTVSADVGTVSANREVVTLSGGVRATRDAEASKSARGGTPVGPATFTTEKLRVEPKASRAETDAPVTIEEPRGIIHGVGMVYDNASRTFRLKSAIRGMLQPDRPTK
jgi:lipopolysaccharide export system protein LptC